MNKWTWLDEILQNLIASGISALWCSLIYYGRPVPQNLDMAFLAVLVSVGIKLYKK